MAQSAMQWSPTLVADKQRARERLVKEVQRRNIEMHRLLQLNQAWQHEKHLALTRPELMDKPGARRVSGQLTCGLFIPGKVQSGRLSAVWCPSAPPAEVLRPTAVEKLRRVMAVPQSPALRPPPLDASCQDAVLCCWPLDTPEPPKPLPARPHTVPERATGRCRPKCVGCSAKQNEPPSSAFLHERHFSKPPAVSLRVASQAETSH